MFRAAVRQVLRQVHPGMHISREAVDLIDQLLRRYLDVWASGEGDLGGLTRHFLRDQARAVAYARRLDEGEP